MTIDGDTDEEFDEEELSDGFDEEIIGDVEIDDDVADDLEGDLEVELEVDDDVEVVEVDDEVVVEPLVVDDDDLADDADVELALDEVLAETIRRTTTPEDDDEIGGDIDASVELAETILPKQDDEFRCASCRLLKKTSQLADRTRTLCRDCV